MNSLNVGVDIVENKRISLNSKFAQKVLHAEEIKLLSNIVSKKDKVYFLAGRWSVKESIIKAIDKPIPFNQINVFYSNNKPSVLLQDYKLSISISHEKKYSVGICIVIS